MAKPPLPLHNPARHLSREDQKRISQKPMVLSPTTGKFRKNCKLLKKAMKKGYLTLIIIGAIVLIAIITNPPPERHKDAVKTEINKLMQKEISKEAGDAGTTGQVFGTLIGGAVVDRMVDTMVSTDNYLLFSTTKVTWEGQTRVIGIGAFGNVFITRKIKGD
jgi:hypothetical protein